MPEVKVYCKVCGGEVYEDHSYAAGWAHVGGAHLHGADPVVAGPFDVEEPLVKVSLRSPDDGASVAFEDLPERTARYVEVGWTVERRWTVEYVDGVPVTTELTLPGQFADVQDGYPA